MNIIHIVDSEGGALRPLASLLKQHFAYYKVSYFDTAEEVFAELQGGVCPSLLIVGLPAINEQSVMLMVEARRFWPTLPVLVTAAWDENERAPVFEGFKFVALDKLETSPVAHAAGMLFGAERMSTPGDDDDDSLTLSDVLQLHAIQKSTGSLRFGGRSRARVSLADGLPVTAKAGNRKGKKALTRLLRRSSLKRCIFDPEPPEEHEFELSFEELVQLFTRPSDAANSGAAQVVEDVDEIDAKDLLAEGGIETLLTLDSRPTLERIEETMRLLMSRDSVSEKLDSIKLHTPVSEESGELASLVESYELASGLDEETGTIDDIDAEKLLDETRGKNKARESAEKKALPKPSNGDIKPPQNPHDAEGMNKKATLFISHDLIAAAAGERDDDSEWSDASEASEVSEALELSEISESPAISDAPEASPPVHGREEPLEGSPNAEEPTARIRDDVPEVVPDEDADRDDAEDVEDAEADDQEGEPTDIAGEDVAADAEDVVEESEVEEILLEDEVDGELDDEHPEGEQQNEPPVHELDEEPDEEPAASRSEELDVSEGTVEVDEDAILEEHTDEHLPVVGAAADGDGRSTLTGAPMSTYPRNNTEEPEDPWADLAKEVADPPSPPEPPAPPAAPVQEVEAPRGDGEQEATPLEEDADAEDRDLSRRLRAGAKDLLRHLKPPSGQPPTPEASSSGGRKSPSDPEQFPRVEPEDETSGLEQVTRAVGDEESFSDIVIEELEQGDALRHERGLDDQLSTVDRPLAVDFAARDMARFATDIEQDRNKLINQELIDTAEQTAVPRPQEASSAELDADFGENWDLLGDGLSESINDSLGFSSVVEEISMAEVVSIEEVETNEYARQEAPSLSSEKEDSEKEDSEKEDSEKEDDGAESVAISAELGELSEPGELVILEDDKADADTAPPEVGEEPAEEIAPEDSPRVVPEDVATAVREALETLQGVPGLVAVALVDTDAEACFDFMRIEQIEAAATWPAEEMVTSAAMSIRAQRDLLVGLGQNATFEDVLFAVGSQHYILRPLDPEARWLLGLLEYTPRSNIALTRLLLGNACTALGEILESIMNIPASASRKTPTRA